MRLLIGLAEQNPECSRLRQARPNRTITPRYRVAPTLFLTFLPSKNRVPLFVLENLPCPLHQMDFLLALLFLDMQ